MTRSILVDQICNKFAFIILDTCIVSVLFVSRSVVSCLVFRHVIVTVWSSNMELCPNGKLKNRTRCFTDEHQIYDIILTAHPGTELSVSLKRFGQIGVNIYVTCTGCVCVWRGGGCHSIYFSNQWIDYMWEMTSVKRSLFTLARFLLLGKKV